MKEYTDISPPSIGHDADFLEMISFIVCRVCEMDQAILMSDLKSRKFSDVRNLYMHFACLYCRVSQAQIGETCNRTSATVGDAFASIKTRFLRKDRKIYSRYLDIKHEIDQAIECLYPATHYERIAYIEQVSRVNLML